MTEFSPIAAVGGLSESGKYICVAVEAGGARRWKLFKGGGIPGEPGPAGPPGTIIRNGDGAPDNAVGNDGDIYIRSNGDWSVRESGAYVLKFNTKGPPGAGGGSGGTFQLEPDGAPGAELAPQAGADWNTLSTNVVAGADYVEFTGAAALAMAQKTSAGIKDNTLYNCQVEIFDYIQGQGELLLYGPTTGHLGISARFTANGTYTFPLTTNGATGTQLNQIRMRCNGAGTHSFKARVSVKEAGSASVYPARTFDILYRERVLSICDGGIRAENTAAQNYSAWNSLIATYGRRRWYIPSDYGFFDITALPIYWDAVLEGDGRRYSGFNITGSGAMHGCDVRGPATFDRGVEVNLAGFALLYTGSGLTPAGTGPGQGNWSGMYVRTKCNMNEITVEDFTNDGVYYAPWDANEATGDGGTIDRSPFFSKVARLYCRGNGRDGLVVRRGANAHLFEQIQLISNGRYGLYHLTDGYATYSNLFNEGQASYNGSVGWMFNNGTNIETHTIYAEQNGCSEPGNNATAYATTLIDMHFGDNCTDSDFVTGALFGGTDAIKLSHVRLPGFNPTRIKVREGGRLRYGTW